MKRINSLLLNNELIDNFMGVESSTNDYHLSWNSMIPVLKKIREIVNTEFGVDEFDKIRYLEQRLNPYNYDIDSIYIGVVEFIKTYNHKI